MLEDLADGRDYLIIATREWTTLDRDELDRDLAQAVAEIAPGRIGRLVALEDIERMILIHPAVPAQFGGPAPLGLRLDEWAASLETDRYPFTADPRRTQLVENIRAFATGPASAVHLHVFGDSGIGKSRAVYEALSPPGIRERVAAHLEYSDHARRALVDAARSAATHVIMVVDEVEPYEAEQLARAASIAGPRIRLITIGDRSSRRERGDVGSLDVLPLDEGIVTTLVERVTGLSPEDARLVASLTEGFPKLAILLAETVRESLDRPSVTALLRSRRVHELLRNMIADDATRRDLAHLALVSRIGFDDELATETAQLCSAFELDRLHFRATVDEETNRFVATAGRYRRVSPGALAVWLAQELIRDAPDAFVRHVTSLPDSLFDSFRTQLQMLGGDPLFDSVIAEVVAGRASTFRTVTELTATDANLLNAVAFASPELAARVMRSAVASTPLPELHVFADGRRRAFVWALQHLLWFESTFDDAATSLLALAVAENESWANNATGVLADAFQMFLGGTEVPLSRRFAWLEGHAHDFGDASRGLAVQLLGASIRAHEGRGGGWQGARLQPVEWQPATPEEAGELRQRALELLVKMAREYAELADQVGDVLAGSLWHFVRLGDLATFADAARAANWSIQTRSELATTIARHLRLDRELDPTSRRTLEALVEHLRGSAPTSHLESVLAVEVWDLERGDGGDEPPQELVALTDELARDTLEGVIRAVLAVQVRRETTTFALFRVLGQRHPELRDLADADRLPAEAQVGYIAGLASSDWEAAASVISRWQIRPDKHRLLPWLVSMLAASPELARVAVDAVTSGSAPLSELNRLRLGGWSRSLPASSVIEIVDAYLVGSPTGFDLEAAIGLVDSWIDAHPDAVAELMDRPARLVTLAAAYETSERMLAYSRNRLADRLRLPVSIRLPATITVIERSDGAEGEDVVALGEMAHQDPDAVVPVVLDLVLERNSRRILLERAHLVSVMSRAAGDDTVISHLLGRPREDQLRALRHVDFTSPHLDPIVVALLERWADDDDFVQQAVARFIFPGEVVRGPYSHRLQERRDQVAEIETSHPSPAVRRWAAQTVGALNELIAGQIRREAEEAP